LLLEEGEENPCLAGQLKVLTLITTLSLHREVFFFYFSITTKMLPVLCANVGKQSVTFMAIDIWKDLPSSLKDLSVLAFSKQIKRYLLSEQKLN